MYRPSVSALFFICSAVISAFVIFGDDSLERLKALKLDLILQQQANQAQEERVKALKKEVELMKSSKRYVEKVAREKLLLSKEGELLFLFE
jgi:cell division protein FtsB